MSVPNSPWFNYLWWLIIRRIFNLLSTKFDLYTCALESRRSSEAADGVTGQCSLQEIHLLQANSVATQKVSLKFTVWTSESESTETASQKVNFLNPLKFSVKMSLFLLENFSKSLGEFTENPPEHAVQEYDEKKKNKKIGPESQFRSYIRHLWTLPRPSL